MFKVIGQDGKEYGPASLDQVNEWITQGRVNTHTLVQVGGAGGWKPAGQIAEIQSLLIPAIADGRSAGPALPPPMGAVPPVTTPKQGLAITSFILGIVSFVFCLGLLTGIPAIICGHAAKNRVRRSPEEYGGRGLAKAGLILGYLSVLYTVLILALLAPIFANSSTYRQIGVCNSHMKQIGLALRVWGMDHEGQFPFNVSTNAGGTKELCRAGADGFDSNAPVHLALVGKELGSTAILICPADSSKKPAEAFANLKPENISYLLRTGSDVTDTNLSEILLKCPLHGTLLRCDGSVEVKTGGRRLRL